MLSQRILSKIFDNSVQRLNSIFSEVNSGTSSAPQYGYVHLLDQGNSLFITPDRQSCLISIEFTLYFHLKTGDYIQARTTYSSECNYHVVTEIISVNHVTYDNAPVIKPERTFQLAGENVHLGTSVLVPATDNRDIANKVSQIAKSLPADTIPMFLSFDGRPTNFDIPNASFTSPNYTSREKLMTCLVAFFQAKQQSDIGKDVVLIIDSLDKMFMSFNNCMQSAGVIDPNLLSTAAVIDFEHILCTSSNLKAGGSLTIIGLHCTGNSPQMLHITDRLHQIIDQIVAMK